MRRPFTVLNLSDLHIDAGKPRNLRALKSLPVRMNEFILKRDAEDRLINLKWQPDFIVVSGDIVDGGSKDITASYKQAGKIFGLFEKHLSCNPRIILTPGNHDRKSIPDDILKKPEELKKHKSIHGKVIRNLKKLNGVEYKPRHKKVFMELHEDNLLDFCNFNRGFIPANSDEFEYHSCDALLGNTLKYATGLKVSHRFKTCFMCLNTEWLYTRSKISSKDEVEFFKPAIIEYSKVLEEYPDYTVITLMHRSPDKLSWNTQNHQEQRQEDVLGLIERHSDIIISGHDHPAKTKIPDMIRNRIQHFRSGTPSCDVKRNEKFPYSASALHIDPIGHTVELLDCQWIGVGGKATWDFKWKGKYKLRDKFTNLSGRVTAPDHYLNRAVRLTAKSTSPADIIESVRSHFPDKGHKLVVKPLADASGIKSLEKNTRLVLYVLELHSAEFMEKRQEIIDRFRKEILLMEVVIDFVLVETPYNGI